MTLNLEDALGFRNANHLICVERRRSVKRLDNSGVIGIAVTASLREFE